MSELNYTYAIDISHWWEVEWHKIPQYVRLVLIKATEGDYMVDPSLASHVEGALGTGRHVGLYHFYRTSIGGRPVPPEAQAQYFLHHTQQYWDDVNLRANDFERGPRSASTGEYYNPTLGSESHDLHTFHRTLHQSDWLAFDLLYTGAATWQDMKLENPANLWRGPSWIAEEPFIDGLWLAWWPYRRPKNDDMLKEFVPRSFSPRLPRPFERYWMWQFAADFPMPGLLVPGGMMTKMADLSVILHPPEVVDQMLGAYHQHETESADVRQVMAAYRAGWKARSDDLIAHLQRTREYGQE